MKFEITEYDRGFDMMMFIDAARDEAFDEAIAYAVGDANGLDSKDFAGVMRDIMMSFTDHLDFSDSGYSDEKLDGIYDGFEASFKFRWDEYFMAGVQ